MEVLRNLLPRWLKRLSVIPLYRFSTFIKYKINQLFAMKKVASDKPKNPIEEYAEDIHSFYMQYEGENQPRNYLRSHSGITPRVRASLVNLIVEVHQKLRLDTETLYLTVSIFDRFLTQETVARVEANLVAMCAIFIASKYEEVSTPPLQDFTDIWMLRYSTSDVLKMEKRILNRLEWSLSLPTPYMFLVRYINIEKTDKESMGTFFPASLLLIFIILNGRILEEIERETECMIFFYSELALTQHFLIEMCPSLIAASCVYAARRTLKKIPLWTEALRRCTRYSKPQLLECAQILVYAHAQAPKSIRNSVYDKYSTKFKNVALSAPAMVEACSQ